MLGLNNIAFLYTLYNSFKNIIDADATKWDLNSNNILKYYFTIANETDSTL